MLTRRLEVQQIQYDQNLPVQHGSSAHSCSCLSFPGQGAPRQSGSVVGAGSSQLLWRVLTPWPQVNEQLLQVLQLPQFPSTEIESQRR